MRKTNLYSFLLSALIGLFPAIADAAVAPVATYVGSYAGGELPTRIAGDSQGRIYVTDPGYKSVRVLSNSGKFISHIAGLETPMSVAVDTSGNIYVGDSRDISGGANVSVFDRDRNFLFKLGSGNGEFGSPVDIAISQSTGNIYVVDSRHAQIKVYRPDGSFAFAFGGDGTAAGKFGGVYGIAVDDIAGEVIVSDWNSGSNNSARIQIFSLNGVFKSLFTTLTDCAKFTKIQGVAVDKDGRVYVVDGYESSVQVFDKSGACLALIGRFGTVPGTLRLPFDVYIDPDNKLFITSRETGRVEAYGLDTFNALSLNPESLAFEGDLCGTTPPPQSFNVTNSGNGVLDWAAVANMPWLSLVPSSGQAPSQSEVSVNMSGMGAGTYTGLVTVTAASGTTGTAQVKLTVNPCPVVLDVSPSTLNFSSQFNGVAPQSKYISITNTGRGTINWSGSADQTWISLEPASGSGDSAVSVTANTSGLNAGSYNGRITIASPGAQGTPKFIDVSLNLISAGNINVTTNLSSSTFTITGPANYAGSGATYSIADAPSGEYTITYGNIIGYTRPVSEKKTLVSGGSITFTGNYSDIKSPAERRVIITGQGPGPQNTALVKLWYKDGRLLSQFMASDLRYGVNVAAGDINGDGIDDIITGPGPGNKNPAQLKAFSRNGSLIGQLNPFSYSYGLYVASGDIDSDGKAEVAVGAGPDPKNPAHVRVFTFDPSSGFIDTGINFYPYNYSYGVKVAIGDIDGDGHGELITAPGPDPKNPSLIKIWKIDTSRGVGYWRVSEIYSFTAFESKDKYGANIATGDIDGDDISEIIVGTGPDPNAQSIVKVFKANGAVISGFTADASAYGANVASSDIDGDGLSDVIIGSGHGPQNRATVRTFNAAGAPAGLTFDAFDVNYGVNVAVGLILD